MQCSFVVVCDAVFSVLVTLAILFFAYAYFTSWLHTLRNIVVEYSITGSSVHGVTSIVEKRSVRCVMHRVK